MRDFVKSMRGSPWVQGRISRLPFIYVISVELAEKVIEGTAYHLTTAEEDALLRRRLEQVIDAMTFNRPAEPAATP